MHAYVLPFLRKIIFIYTSCNLLHFFRNGKVIDPSRDKNFLLSGSGHLIIVSARFSDAGNYSCRAENVAGARNSPQAALTIYGRKK